MGKNKKKHIPLPLLAAGGRVIDTHCHLDMGAYAEDLDEVVERAFAAGVRRIITVGIDLASSRKAIKLAERLDGVFATIGIHPHHVDEVTDETYDELRKLAGHPKVVAYGEIGMDTVKNYSPVALQREHFRKQVDLAKELGLPIIIHDREAHDEVMEILESAAPFPAGGVMHCYSGDAALAERVLALGFYISIPGVVTFNKAEMLQEAVQAVPVASLLLETDGPFLAPVPRRGKRNEPEFMLYTAAKVAELKGVALDELAAQTTANAERLFQIGER